MNVISPLGTPELLILTEGGQGSGLGHISRCCSLYWAWQKRCGFSCWLIGDGGEEIEAALGDVQGRRIPWRQQPELLKPWLSRRPFVLIDSYHLSVETYTYLYQHAHTVLCLDDCQQFKYPDAHYLNGALFSERLPYPPGEHLLGSTYLPLRPPFWSAVKKPVKAQVERLFVSFGGGDFQGFTGRLLPLLLDYSETWQIELIIGPFFRERERLLQHRLPRVNYLISPDASAMARAMDRSDLALATAGQTLYELAAWGVPTLAILAADNQKANARAWQEAGLVYYLGEGDDGLERRLEKALNLFDYSRRRQASAAGRKYVDGQGALRVVDWILRQFS